jgi:Fe-S-cluster containining protein
MGGVQRSVGTSEDVGCECNGACCKRINLETNEVEACHYLTDDNLCSIYEDRPIACRIAEYNTSEMTAMHCYLCTLSLKMRVSVPVLLDHLKQSDITN